MLCNTCIAKPKPVEIKELEVISPANELPFISTNLPTYTASYLNNKLKKDYNSIINERCCIKVGDKYILHEDIINHYKSTLLS